MGIIKKTLMPETAYQREADIHEAKAGETFRRTGKHLKAASKAQAEADQAARNRQRYLGR